MAILIRCASCGRTMRAKDAFRGRRVQCPSCGQQLAAEGERVPDHEVFICHSSGDKEVANAVCAALEKKQIRCWIAPRDVLAGRTWGGAIIDAIEESRVMVILLSRRSNGSDQVLREIERAAAKSVRIMPVRIEDAPLSRDLEYFLSASHWLDAFDGPLELHIDRLCGMVQTLLAEIDPRRGGARPVEPAADGARKAGQRARAPAARRSGRRTLALAAAAALPVMATLFFVLRPPSEARVHAGPEADGSASEVAAAETGSQSESPDSGEARVHELVSRAELSLGAADVEAAAAAIAQLGELRSDSPRIAELRARLRALEQECDAARDAGKELERTQLASALAAGIGAAEAAWGANPQLRTCSGLDVALADARERLAAHEALVRELGALEARVDQAAFDVAAASAIEGELADLAPALDFDALRRRIEALRGRLDARVAEALRAVDTAAGAVVAARGLQAFSVSISDPARALRLREEALPLLERIDREIEGAADIGALAPLAVELSVEIAAPADGAADLRLRRDALLERAAELARAAQDVPSALAVLVALDACISSAAPGELREGLRAAAEPACSNLSAAVAALSSVLEQGASPLLSALSAEPPAAFAAQLAEVRAELVETARVEASEGSASRRLRFAGNLTAVARERTSGALRAELEALAAEVVAAVEAAWSEQIEESGRLADRGSFADAKRTVEEVIGDAPRGARTWIQAMLAKAENLRKEGVGDPGPEGRRWKVQHLSAVDVYDELLLGALEAGDPDGVPILKRARERLAECCDQLHDYFLSYHKAHGTNDSKRDAKRYADKRDRVQQDLRGMSSGR